MGVGMPADLLLDEFGLILRHAFGHYPYHVGSSLRLKNGWRDVDVRIMLPDEEWAAQGYDKPGPGREHENAKWCAMCTAFSILGRQMTGLPIDFQLQQVSAANAAYPGFEDHPRSALSICASRRLLADH